MIINKNSLIIDGVNFGKYTTQVDFEYNKIWGSKTGRNMSGEMKGKMVGIFPKLVLTFKKLSQEDLEVVSPIMNRESQNTSYYDPDLKRQNTISTYSGDWKYTSKDTRKVSPSTCSVIAKKRR